MDPFYLLWIQLQYLKTYIGIIYYDIFHSNSISNIDGIGVTPGSFWMACYKDARPVRVLKMR
jgi:hypothetical protein